MGRSSFLAAADMVDAVNEKELFNKDVGKTESMFLAKKHQAMMS